jgi:hypothetical protein
MEPRQHEPITVLSLILAALSMIASIVAIVIALRGGF